MSPRHPKSVADACLDEALADSFFRAVTDSTPPVVESLADPCDAPAVAEESPERVARRAQLRKGVGALLAAAAVFAMSGVVRTSLSHRGSGVETRVAVAPPVPAQKSDAVAAGDTAVGVAASAQADSAPGLEDDEALPDPIEGARLRKVATTNLERGKYKDAIETARAATIADPSHATGWLLLGSALQTTGKWKEGVAAYSQCAHMADHGPVWECRAMGGR